MPITFQIPKLSCPCIFVHTLIYITIIRPLKQVVCCMFKCIAIFLCIKQKKSVCKFSFWSWVLYSLFFTFQNSLQENKCKRIFYYYTFQFNGMWSHSEAAFSRERLQATVLNICAIIHQPSCFLQVSCRTEQPYA